MQQTIGGPWMCVPTSSIVSQSSSGEYRCGRSVAREKRHLRPPPDLRRAGPNFCRYWHRPSQTRCNAPTGPMAAHIQYMAIVYEKCPCPALINGLIHRLGAIPRDQAGAHYLAENPGEEAAGREQPECGEADGHAH